MLHRSRQGTRTHTHTQIYHYMYIYPQAAWFAGAVIDNVEVGLGWEGWGWGGGVWAGSGGAIALLGWAGFRLVLWLLRFHGGVATLLDRCGCYIDVTPLLDFHVGVVTFILDRCYVFREGLLY